MLDSPASCGYNSLAVDGDEMADPTFSTFSFVDGPPQEPSPSINIFGPDGQPEDPQMFSPLSFEPSFPTSMSPPPPAPATAFGIANMSAVASTGFDDAFDAPWAGSPHPAAPVFSPSLHANSPLSMPVNMPTFAPVPSAGPLSPPLAAPRFTPHFGDHPSRTLYVQHPFLHMLAGDELQTIFGQFGDLRAIFTDAAQTHQYILVSYFDIRHAKNAVRRLVGYRYQNVCMDIHYSIPVGVEAVQNQGTIVVFNLDPSSTNDELAQLFGAYGELKEIRETPNKKHHRFIEFYDVREADAAMAGLNKREIRGKRIKIEPSRPGGARRSMVQRVQPASGWDDGGGHSLPRSFGDQTGHRWGH